jgi:tetratricopeptide (TPR) repeat protein
LDSFYTQINFDHELKFLDKLPSGIYTKFIHSLLLKKQTRFRDMFDTLSALLENKPRFYSFYNELAFSAAALNQLSSLEAQVNRIYTSPDLNVFKNYLLALINLNKGEYKDALTYFQKSYKIDSANADIILQYSNAYRNSGDYERAYKILIKGRDICKR